MSLLAYYRGRSATLLCTLTLMFAADASAATPSLYQQREDYKAALDYLTAGQTSRFQAAQADLKSYILAPYLAYYELQSRLSGASQSELQRFEKNYGELPVADIIYFRWLKRLGARRDWATFLENYRETTDAELNCYRLRALYGTGERERAFEAAGELWMVAKSQPKACDPLFDVWISNGNLTERMVWTRLQLALDANNRTLARYLQRFFKGTTAQLAQAYYNVHVTPSNITRTSRYRTDNQYQRDVVRHGLVRLARRHPHVCTFCEPVYSLLV